MTKPYGQLRKIVARIPLIGDGQAEILSCGHRGYVVNNHNCNDTVRGCIGCDLPETLGVVR